MGADEPDGAAREVEGAPRARTRSCSPRTSRRQARRRRDPHPGRARASATSSSRRSTCAKGFGDRLLVEDLTFSLPPGGIVGVIGPNGAGKTTLFRMIAGEEQPDGGALRVGETVQLAYVDQSPRRPRPAEHGLEGDLREPGHRPARQARGQLAPVRLLVQLPRRRPAEARRGPLRRRAQPRPPREAAASRAATCSCSTSRRTTSTSTRCARSRTRCSTSPAAPS